MNPESTTSLLVPEVEVSAKAKRRIFTLEFKRRILREAEACSRPGEVGALLRREGLYTSHLSAWRAARERGEIVGLSPRKRGRRAKRIDPRDGMIRELERENARLKARVERAEALVELQKKVSAILGIALPESDAKN
jgi:transposase-like protein